MRSAAASYGPYGIRVNAVAPGLVETPLTETVLRAEATRKASEGMHALRRLGQPDDIAAAIEWLLDPATSWVTGQELGVDGGLGTVRARGGVGSMDPLGLLLLQLFATAALTGLIWTIQLVQYPGFLHMTGRGFRRVHTHHTMQITKVVLPLMAAELLVALYLIVNAPAGTPGWMPAVGAALVGVIWLSTAFVQVPLHGRLSMGLDEGAASRLVRTNWVRTIAWSARSALAAAWIAAVAS